MNVGKGFQHPDEDCHEGRMARLGVVEWFRVGEHQRVLEALGDIETLGITKLRTGISWADWHNEGAADWYDWFFSKIPDNLELLPCFLWTPPSMGIAPRSNSPPQDPKSYADFIDTILTRYGKHFEWVELWNEPNNISEWDWRLDPSWKMFARMVGGAAYWARRRGWKTVLGGMSPIDVNWLGIMFVRGVMPYIDVVGIHGFPDSFDPHWDGWIEQVRRVRERLDSSGHDGEIWITETGYSTWSHQGRRQIEIFLDALNAPAPRVYWYSLHDLDPTCETVDGFHCNEADYHFGLKHATGKPKPLFRLIASGVEYLHKQAYLCHAQPRRGKTKHALITGGAGFIGTNLAHRLMSNGQRVIIYDNLARPGVERNIEWLRQRHGELLDVVMADVRDRWELDRCVRYASSVFHLAAQVAVTTSISSPQDDFDVNAQGTLCMLEALRNCPEPPGLLFTSTNKVYGALNDIQLMEVGARYEPREPRMRRNGIDENRPLDFHSPYGCSKGCADQYVLDYCRTFGISTVVFRMSCIYGPHQLGTEDQGWLAHFLIRTVEGGELTIYGDGKQVRDVLYVDELINAMLLAMQNLGAIGGEAYNIGGGPASTISLLELLEMIEELHGCAPRLMHQPWRTGDQRYYVSNINRFSDATGWKPSISVHQGLRRLYEWLNSSGPVKTVVPGHEMKQKMHLPQAPSATQMGAA